MKSVEQMQISGLFKDRSSNLFGLYRFQYKAFRMSDTRLDHIPMKYDFELLIICKL